MILVSAGHNPEAPGACFGKYCEHAEAVKWVDEILNQMESMARRVPTGTLPEKVQFINDQPLVHAAIEVHFNSDTSHKGHGALCCYDSNKSIAKDLAVAIESRLIPIFGQHWRGVMEGWYHMDRPGIVDYPGDVDGDEHHLYFLQRTKCPAVILEPEFIYNFLKIESNREAACTAIVDGLLEFYEKLSSDDYEGAS